MNILNEKNTVDRIKLLPRYKRALANMYFDIALYSFVIFSLVLVGFAWFSVQA